VSPELVPPDFETLVDWVEGRLEPATAAAVAEAVEAGDARVRGTVEWLARFAAAAAEVPLQDPPPIIRQRLHQQFQARTSREAATPIADVHGSLLFDSRHDVAAAGMRGGPSGDEVIHLAYTSSVGDLVLDIHPGDAGLLRIEGQVLSADAASPVFEASARGAGWEVRTVDGDALGRFQLEQVPPHVDQLTASNGQFSLRVELDLS